MMTTTPAQAQDGKAGPRASKKRQSPKGDGAAQKRAAEKHADAAKKRKAARKAAAAAERAEAEAAAATAEADEAAEEEGSADAEDTRQADPDSQEEDLLAGEDDDDAVEAVVVEETQPAAKPPARRRRRGRKSVPSPERTSPPPYRWAGPYTMEYIEGSEVPDGYTKVERVRRGLVIGGAVTWGVSWLIAAAAAASMDDNIKDDTGPLFIPVVGPFIAMGTLEPEGVGRAGLFINGMAQVAGATMLISGLAATKTVLVRTKYSQVNVRPGLGNLQLDGTF